jgi:hypothetical protein
MRRRRATPQTPPARYAYTPPARYAYTPPARYAYTPACASASSTTLLSSIARVIGPAPPGTGAR